MDRYQLDKLIVLYQYAEAEQILKQIPFEKTKYNDLFVCIAFNTFSISIFGFLMYLMDLGWEKRFIYDCLTEIFAYPLCCYEGGYSLGLFYCKKMLDEEPSPENLQFLFFFNDIPETLIDDKTAVRAAKRILASNPDDVTALGIMRRRAAKVGNVDLPDEAEPFWEISMYDRSAEPDWEMFSEAVWYTRYADAEAMLLHLLPDEEKQSEWILAAASDSELALLGLLIYLIDENWSKALVYKWIVLALTCSMSHIEGAYGLALYYCRKLVTEAETLDNLRLLLSFTDAPGNFMGRDEAEDVARRILALDANDAKAREVLELVGGTG